MLSLPQRNLGANCQDCLKVCYRCNLWTLLSHTPEHVLSGDGVLDSVNWNGTKHDPRVSSRVVLSATDGFLLPLFSKSGASVPFTGFSSWQFVFYLLLLSGRDLFSINGCATLFLAFKQIPSTKLFQGRRESFDWDEKNDLL